MNTFSVVIPTLNEQGVVKNLLQDLQEQTEQEIEIIIVDGHSTDATLEEVKEFDAVTVLSSERGVGRQRNEGAAHSKGEIIVFLDADTRIQPDFLEKICTEFKRQKFDIACPRYVLDGSNRFLQLSYSFFNSIFYLTRKVAPSGGGMCMMVRREFFIAQKGFREDINFEDMELIRRLGRKGRFTIMPCDVIVSDRRFRKYGTIRTLLLYARISIYFMFGKFERVGKITYSFGEY